MRIIAGEFKGRRLLAARGCRTRPMTDRVKVSLFGMLAPELPGADVADLFCGTGSFGLEAISRGARHCWFADRDRQAIDLLRQNLQALGAGDRATIWQGDVIARLPAWLTELPGPLDIVSLDPPYEMARQWFGPLPETSRARDVGRRQAGALLTTLAPTVEPDGAIVLRTPRDVVPDGLPSGLQVDRRREYGSMAVNFIRHEKRNISHA